MYPGDFLAMETRERGVLKPDYRKEYHSPCFVLPLAYNPLQRARGIIFIIKAESHLNCTEAPGNCLHLAALSSYVSFCIFQHHLVEI